MTALLLPRNRTDFEKAVETVNAERYPLPAHLVKAVWSPDNCPSDLLGYLAEQLSVDVWEDSWPDVKKREVCRNALLLHRLKTTPAGIRAHVALTGATVLKIIRPPARGSLRGAMTEEMRLAWLDSLPQVRIYPFARKTFALERHFANGKGVSKQFHSARPVRAYGMGIETDDGTVILGYETRALVTDEPLVVHGFLRTSRGKQLYGRRATYYDRGEEFDVTLSGDESNIVERVMLRRERVDRVWHGFGFQGRGYLSASDAASNVVSIRASDDAESFAIERGVEPVDVRPQRIAQQRIAPDARAFGGRHRPGTFLLPTYAPLLIYDRIALNDPTRIGARRKVLSWHGRGRFGIEPYTAEIKIRVPMLRKKRTSGRWHGVGYRKGADMSPLWKATQAVRVSKAFRDTVRIDTATIGRVRFGGSLRFGDFTFGEMKEVL